MEKKSNKEIQEEIKNLKIELLKQPNKKKSIKKQIAKLLTLTKTKQETKQ